MARQTGLLLLDATTPQAAPQPSGIWLSAEGRLRLAARPGVAGDVAPGLAQLLKALLPESAPPDLATLADSSNAKVATATLTQYVEALTFFCRPDDIAELAQLAERGADVHAANQRTAALHALTERSRHASPAIGDTPSRSRKPLTTRRLAMALAAALIVVVGGAGAAWTLTRAGNAASSPAGGTSTLQRVASRVHQSLTTAAALVQESIETQPAPAVGRGADLTLPARHMARGKSIPEPAGVAATGTLASTAPAMASAPSPTPSAPEAPVVVPAPFIDAVFSASNADVLPPALERPQMPEARIGGLPVGQPGVLELVVGPDGQVTTARLVPASSRHQDRMMVSAAKAWRFTPARRDGQAVSYRLQLPITW